MLPDSPETVVGIDLPFLFVMVSAEAMGGGGWGVDEEKEVANWKNVR